jgi:hypothetical protein
VIRLGERMTGGALRIGVGWGVDETHHSGVPMVGCVEHIVLRRSDTIRERTRMSAKQDISCLLQQRNGEAGALQPGGLRSAESPEAFDRPRQRGEIERCRHGAVGRAAVRRS